VAILAKTTKGGIMNLGVSTIITTKHQKWVGGLIAIVFLQQMGCSAKVEGGPGLPPFDPPASVFSKPSIQGPKVEALWRSACTSYGYSGSKQTEMLFQSNEFSYTQKTFSDRLCSSLQSLSEKKGTFQFSSIMSENIYAIDYSYKQGGIQYIDEGQLLKLENETLFISEFQYTQPTLNLEMPFYKVITGLENEYSN